MACIQLKVLEIKINKQSTYADNAKICYQDCINIREFKQTRRRRQRERHLKMKLRICVFAIISQFVKVAKCALTILELN